MVSAVARHREALAHSRVVLIDDVDVDPDDIAATLCDGCAGEVVDIQARPGMRPGALLTMIHVAMRLEGDPFAAESAPAVRKSLLHRPSMLVLRDADLVDDYSGEWNGAAVVSGLFERGVILIGHELTAALVHSWGSTHVSWRGSTATTRWNLVRAPGASVSAHWPSVRRPAGCSA